MAALFIWISNNWFALLQALGIIGGLTVTACSIHKETKARKVSDFLTLTEQHRNLWSEVFVNPDLERILDAHADVAKFPVSKKEEQFLNGAIVHFIAGWHLAREGSLLTIDTLEDDVRWFFRLPLPQAVWEKSKAARDDAFVAFVEKALERR